MAIFIAVSFEDSLTHRYIHHFCLTNAQQNGRKVGAKSEESDQQRIFLSRPGFWRNVHCVVGCGDESDTCYVMV